MMLVVRKADAHVTFHAHRAAGGQHHAGFVQEVHTELARTDRQVVFQQADSARPRFDPRDQRLVLDPVSHDGEVGTGDRPAARQNLVAVFQRDASEVVVALTLTVRVNNPAKSRLGL